MLLPGIEYVSAVPLDPTETGGWAVSEAVADVSHGVTCDRCEVIPFKPND
jgi:hypothetical protein